MLLSLKLRYVTGDEAGLYLVATCAAPNAGRRKPCPVEAQGAEPERALAFDGYVLTPGGTRCKRRRGPAVTLMLLLCKRKAFLH